MLHSNNKINKKANDETIIAGSEDEHLTPEQKYFQDILFRYSGTFSTEVRDKDIFRAGLVDLAKTYDIGLKFVYDTADMLYCHFIGSTIVNAISTNTFKEEELRKIIKYGRYMHYVSCALQDYISCLSKENIEPTSEEEQELFNEVVAKMTSDIKKNHNRIWGLTV